MGDKNKEPLPWKEFIAGQPSRWKRPFLRFEWLCERLAYGSSKWAFIQVLEYVGKLSLLGAMLTFLWGIPERRRAAEDQRKTKHYQAWQTINSALGQSGNGGRTDALEDLRNDKISLAGVNVSGSFLMDLDLHNAYMQFARMTNVIFVRPNFSNAYLWRAKFQDSYLENAVFSHANLSGAIFSDCRFRRGDSPDRHPADFAAGFCADFSGANLSEAWMDDAILGGVNFTNAILSGATFSNSDLRFACLAGANLLKTSFEKANLGEADFRKANMEGVEFEFAYFNGANLAGVLNWMKIADLSNANVYGIQNAPNGFMEWATNKMGAVSIPMNSYSAWTEWLSRNGKR